MKKIIVLLGCLATSCMYAQGNFKFVEESHDFGKVPEGDSVSYEFEFTNVGDQPLKITNVQPSCGCTVPKWPAEAIQPGGKGRILAKYATKNRVGAFTKYLTISSDALESSKQIKFVGEVLAASAPADTIKKVEPTQSVAPVKEKGKVQQKSSAKKPAVKKKAVAGTKPKNPQSAAAKKQAPKK